MNNQVKVRITGKNPKTFLKEIISERINIYQIIKEEKSILLRINYDDYQKIKEKKTTYQIEIVEYYGVSKLKHNFKKYIFFLLLWLFGIGINLFLSTRIWSVEVINSNQKLVKIIESDLNRYGIKKYHKKVSFKQKEKIKEKILKKEKDVIEWLEIEEHGTKYIIKIEQKKKNKDEQNCLPRNIISKKNAIIMEIKATNGEIVKKKDDYVLKGETIISGWIHNGENVVSKKCSTGKVYGEVWYKVSVLVPEKKKNSILTGKKKKGISIQLFQKEYNFFHKFRTYEKKEYNIIEEPFFNIKMSLTSYQETEEKIKKLTSKEIEEVALQDATKTVEKKLKEDENVISKKVLKKERKNSKIKVEVFIKVKEDITDYFDISQIEIEEMNEERE